MVKSGTEMAVDSFGLTQNFDTLGEILYHVLNFLGGCASDTSIEQKIGLKLALFGIQLR